VLALKNNSIDEFHERFRSADFLLIDDVQFLSGKAQTQECLVHIFNDLYHSSGQMVITSDRLPKTIPNVTNKLSSRLAGGLVVHLSPPDFETSLAILTAKATSSNAVVPTEVLRFIAMQFKGSVRELEGALNRVLTYAKLSGAKVDMTLALQALADIDGGKILPALTPKLIMDVVATHYGVSPDAIRGKQRDKRTALARQVAIYLLRQETRYSLTEIGKLLNRDHSTIVHNLARISQSMKTDPDLAASVERLRRELKRK
jgi:chromosomal replication initiator protein